MLCRECEVDNSNLYKYCWSCGTKLRKIHEPPPGDVYIRLQITDNKTGAERIFEAVGRDILVGSAPVCDLVLEGEDVLPHHCRLQSISQHLFYLNADREMRVDSKPFEVGRYTLRRC